MILRCRTRTGADRHVAASHVRGRRACTGGGGDGGIQGGGCDGGGGVIGGDGAPGVLAAAAK